MSLGIRGKERGGRVCGCASLLYTMNRLVCHGVHTRNKHMHSASERTSTYLSYAPGPIGVVLLESLVQSHLARFRFVNHGLEVHRGRRSEGLVSRGGTRQRLVMTPTVQCTRGEARGACVQRCGDTRGGDYFSSG